MNKPLFCAALCCTLLLVSSLSFAATPATKGAYFGVNLGYGKYIKTDLGNFNRDLSSISGGIDLGYKFNPYFAIETGLALYNNDNLDTGVIADNNYTLHLAGKIILPFNCGLSVFAKAGAAAVHTRINNSGSLPIENTGNRLKLTLYGGAGGNYFFTPNLAFTAQLTETLKNAAIPYTYMITGGITYIIPEDIVG